MGDQLGPGDPAPLRRSASPPSPRDDRPGPDLRLLPDQGRPLGARCCRERWTASPNDDRARSVRRSWPSRVPTSSGVDMDTVREVRAIVRRGLRPDDPGRGRGAPDGGRPGLGPMGTLAELAEADFARGRRLLRGGGRRLGPDPWRARLPARFPEGAPKISRGAPRWASTRARCLRPPALTAAEIEAVLGRAIAAAKCSAVYDGSRPRSAQRSNLRPRRTGVRDAMGISGRAFLEARGRGRRLWGAVRHHAGHGPAGGAQAYAGPPQPAGRQRARASRWPCWARASRGLVVRLRAAQGRAMRSPCWRPATGPAAAPGACRRGTVIQQDDRPRPGRRLGRRAAPLATERRPGPHSPDPPRHPGLLPRPERAAGGDGQRQPRRQAGLQAARWSANGQAVNDTRGAFRRAAGQGHRQGRARPRADRRR